MPELKTSSGDTILVSSKDWDFLSNYNWYKTKKGYFCASGSGPLKGKRIHRLIADRMGLDTSKYIDHKNRDKSDNRRNNLRPASSGQNRANSVINSNNKSGFKGVHLKKRCKRTSKRKLRSDAQGDRWCAQINVGREKISLGYFDTPEEAHAVYKKASKKYFGEFANP